MIYLTFQFQVLPEFHVYCFTTSDSDAYFETTRINIFSQFWLFVMINNGTNTDKTAPWLNSHFFKTGGRACI